MKESDLKKKIRKLLLAKGAWVFAPVQMGLGETGIPDQIVCMPHVVTQEDVGKVMGRFIGIESKMGYNKPSPKQADHLIRIAVSGGQALVVTGDYKSSKTPWRVKTVTADMTIQEVSGVKL